MLPPSLPAAILFSNRWTSTTWLPMTMKRDNFLQSKAAAGFQVYPYIPWLWHSFLHRVSGWAMGSHICHSTQLSPCLSPVMALGLFISPTVPHMSPLQ